MIGYSLNLLTAAASFYKRTGDADIPKEWGPRTQRTLDWTHSQILPDSGLFNISNTAFGGDWNYYDPQQSGIVTKSNMVYAYALQECISLLADAGIGTAPYQSRLDVLRAGINTNLWSNELSAYHLSQSVQNGFGQDSNGLAILAGVTTSNHTTSTALSTLKQLYTPNGPLTFSPSAIGAGFAEYISPYASAYHLRAAFESCDANTAMNLLKTLWAPMADPNGANYTGCFWETLNVNGAPALGRITSLCHAWAAGPTGELSEHVLGVKPATPGYRECGVAPLTLGLEWAWGRFPVPGGEITVAWNATGGVVNRIEITSPEGTKGTVVLPGCVGGTCKVNGQNVIGNGTFPVTGGKLFVVLCDK